MILWIIRQLLSLRKAIGGRAQPSELAWGLAWGVLIGVVPKGNLLAILLIGWVLSLRVNHGIATLAAVACSFLTVFIDPWSHRVGLTLLESSQLRPSLNFFWDLPLARWTDLNNSVVLGSTCLGLVSLMPTYLLSLPLFRALAPRVKVDETQQQEPSLPAPSVEPLPQTPIETWEPTVGSATGSDESTAEVVRIDVIRLQPLDGAPDDTRAIGGIDEKRAEVPPNAQMNETLGYLLRRLRDARDEGRAA